MEEANMVYIKDLYTVDELLISVIIYQVLARLGLYQDNLLLTHNKMNLDRLWQTSKIGSFGSNIAFILSSCGRDK